LLAELIIYGMGALSLCHNLSISFCSFEEIVFDFGLESIGSADAVDSAVELFPDPRVIDQVLVDVLDILMEGLLVYSDKGVFTLVVVAHTVGMTRSAHRQDGFAHVFPVGHKQVVNLSPNVHW